jgi:hypothetical protein
VPTTAARRTVARGVLDHMHMRRNVHRLLACAGPLLLAAACLSAAAAAQLSTGMIAAAGCPFDFQRGMPPGVFCVYEGIALDAAGEVCADPAVVLWSQLAPELGAYRNRPEAADRDVYFGFVTSPDLVVRGTIDIDAENRVKMRDYTVGPHELPLVLHGYAETWIAGGRAGVETLRLRVAPPLDAGGACGFASYDGAFIGVLVLEPGS